jgi:hypothetical protein
MVVFVIVMSWKRAPEGTDLTHLFATDRVQRCRGTATERKSKLLFIFQ